MTREYVAIIGLDEPESDALAARIDQFVVASPIIPAIMVKDGQLLIEARGRFVPVSKVVYHGIFDEDFDFITGLALWGGACLPNARAMMDCRLKFPCLVRALQHTRFGHPRGFVSARARYFTEREQVAKWGNWHCGENKARFNEAWSGEDAAIIEDFFPGRAVRIVIMGDQHWQIALEGDDWLKSIHHDTAAFMPVDPDLLDDTRTIQRAFGLELIANDYIVSGNGEKRLLEVNHIPNVTRFPELWTAYSDFVTAWVKQS